MNIAIFKSRTGDQVMVDSNSEIAFGPTFGEDEDPQEFLDWLGAVDARNLASKRLSECVDTWRQEAKENEDEARAESYYSDTESTTLDEVCEKAKMLK